VQDRLAAQGIFQPEKVGALWADHLARRRNTGQKLWNILMFQAWMKEYVG
jgi:asparagine synthase (glutamine-hydrolysing)